MKFYDFFSVLNSHARLCTLTDTMVNANINEDMVIFFEIHTYQDHTQCVTAKTLLKEKKKIKMIFARCQNKELNLLNILTFYTYTTKKAFFIRQ